MARRHLFSCACYCGSCITWTSSARRPADGCLHPAVGLLPTPTKLAQRPLPPLSIIDHTCRLSKTASGGAVDWPALPTVGVASGGGVGDWRGGQAGEQTTGSAGKRGSSRLAALASGGAAGWRRWQAGEPYRSVRAVRGVAESSESVTDSSSTASSGWKSSCPQDVVLVEDPQ